MELIITGYYTKPGYVFNISGNLLNLLTTTVEEQIFIKHNFNKPNVKSIEILLDCETESDNIKIVKLSKKAGSANLLYSLKLPYNLIVENNTTLPNKFITIFIKAIQMLFIEYSQIPETDYINVEKYLVTQLSEKTIYDYIPRTDAVDWQMIKNKKAS